MAEREVMQRDGVGVSGAWRAAWLLLACGGSPSDADVVRFVSPEPGAVLSGRASAELEVALGAGVTEVQLGLDDAPRITQRGGARFWELNTLAQANGPHTLRLVALGADGREHTAALDVVFDNPAARFVAFAPSQPVYLSADRIELELAYSEPGLSLNADFSELDSGFSPASVRVEDQGDGSYWVRYPLSRNNRRPTGHYRFRITATDAAGQSLENRLPLEYRARPELPVVVERGTFVAADVPAAETGAASAPEPTALDGKRTLLTGGHTDWSVSWTQDPAHPAEKLIVRSDSFSGYYVVPLEPSTASTAQATVRLGLPAFKPGFGGGLLDLSVGVVDDLGQLGRWITQPLNSIAVGADGVQLSLTWDAAVDLDLEVTDPGGGVIDFESGAVSGGGLDLDSNALCEIDGINAENIAWEPGAEVQGEYHVRVNLYDACGAPQVNWELSARFCGVTQTFSGTHTAAEADTSGAGRQVTSFVVECNQRVSGLASFEKQLQLGGSAVTPVPFAPVRVLSVAGALLAQGVTDQNGRYDLRFLNRDLADYHVELEAALLDPARDPGMRLVAVAPLQGEAGYSFRGPELDARLERVRVQDLAVSGPLAGAFNIREQLRRGFAWASEHLGVKVNAALPPIVARWSFDEVPPLGTTYYEDGQLFVLSRPESEDAGADHDEFDDPVLLHEFGHYLVGSASFSPLPSGFHSGPVSPDLAFSEGLATLLGQATLGDPEYRDTFGAGDSNVSDIELSALGYRGGRDLTRSIDESLVASVLWDLIDPANEPHDPFARQRGAVIKTIFGWFPTRGTDRAGNGNDLVDFLDGWRELTESAYDAELQCLLENVGFAYLPRGVACRE